MTLEELWKLFPVFITEHKEIWDKWYEDEQKRLYSLLPSENIIISHIGSTAINGIWAKPIIDILVERYSLQATPFLENISNTVL